MENTEQENQNTQQKPEAKENTNNTQEQRPEISELEKLRKEFEAFKQQSAQEIQNAYIMGQQSMAQQAQNTQTQGNVQQTNELTDDDDPFGTRRLEEKLNRLEAYLANSYQERQSQQTQQVINQAKDLVLKEIDFYNKEIPADQLAQHVVQQALINYNLEQQQPNQVGVIKRSFKQHLAEQAFLVGRKKITPNNTNQPQLDKSVLESQSDYGGQTATGSTSPDLTERLKTELEQAKQRAMETGLPEDQAKVAMLSFQLQGLKV